MLITSINMFQALLSKRKESSGQLNLLPLIRMRPPLDASQAMESLASMALALHPSMKPTGLSDLPSGIPLLSGQMSDSCGTKGIHSLLLRFELAG